MWDQRQLLWVIEIVLIYLLGHVQKLVQVHTSVGELPEGTLLLDLGIRLWNIIPDQYEASTIYRSYIVTQTLKYYST